MKPSNALLTGLLAALTLLTAACSRDDVITGVADRVVTDKDKSLDTAGSFAAVVLGLDPSGVRAVSLPEVADPQFATRIHSDRIYIGISADDTATELTAHMQYYVTAFAADTGNTARYTDDYTPDSAYIYFSEIDRDTSSAAQRVSVPVRMCDTLRSFASPVNRDSDNGEVGNFTLGAGAADSLPLPDSLALMIFQTRTSPDTNQTASFAFSIVDYKGAVRKIQNPYVKLFVSRAIGGDSVLTVIDRVDGITRVTAFEDPGRAAARAGSAYSSYHTQRTAVFEIKLDGIANYRAGYELLNAALSVNTLTQANGEATSRNYRIFVLDTLITNALAVDSAASASLLSLEDRFASYNDVMSGSLIDEKRNVHEDIRIRKPIRDTLRSPDKNSVYVYIRSASEHGVLQWDRSAVRLETIFTPSRSQ